MTTQQPDALQCAADLEYSIARHGMQDALTMNAYRAMKMVRTQLARITELESQLAQRFDAADMATAAQQGVAYAALPDEGEPWRGHKFKEVQRVPLTDEQIKDLQDDDVFFGSCRQIVRAIEAEHGIKGGQHVGNVD